jgi:16S rRNA (cytosine967-C5)-methyltransferase
MSWINSGVAYVQDPSTLMACDLLAPQPGETVLDACAAPGGKAGYLAQLMENQGQLVACDYEKLRLHRLKHNLERLGVANATVLQLDWLHATPSFPPQTFDAILVDAPCTNTGVIRRRTDVRWRLTPQDFGRMQRLQIRILESVLPYLKVGGRLVYSTCSIEADENDEVVCQVLAHSPEFELTATRQVVPTRDELDGAYAALLRRTR